MGELVRVIMWSIPLALYANESWFVVRSVKCIRPKLGERNRYFEYCNYRSGGCRPDRSL